MDEQYLGQAQLWFDRAISAVRGWLVDPGFWLQLGILVAAWVAAILLGRRLIPALRRFLGDEPASEAQDGDLPDTWLARARRAAVVLIPLLVPLLAWAFTWVATQVLQSALGRAGVIDFGSRALLLVAAVIFVREVLKDTFLRFLGRYFLIPVAALHAFGVLDDIVRLLDETVVSLGNISFSAMTVVRGLIAGGLLFWAGMWSNQQSVSYIGRQPLRPALRQLAMKAAEIAIFGVAFLLLLNIMGISLTSLAVLGGAIGIGVGFGLQQIAANYASGIILLVEGQATVGDYVELDGGEAGRIIKMGARATILETFDGRWIVVPNEHFVTTRVVNYSDAGSAHRVEAPFSVTYDTDLNALPAIIEAAVVAVEGVLEDPAPQCELKAFGENGVEFSVEYWIRGLADHPDNPLSDVMFAIWNASQAHGVTLARARRIVELRGQAAPTP